MGTSFFTANKHPPNPPINMDQQCFLGDYLVLLPIPIIPSCHQRPKFVFLWVQDCCGAAQWWNKTVKYWYFEFSRRKFHLKASSNQDENLHQISGKEKNPRGILLQLSIIRSSRTTKERRSTIPREKFHFLSISILSICLFYVHFICHSILIQYHCLIANRRL